MDRVVGVETEYGCLVSEQEPLLTMYERDLAGGLRVDLPSPGVNRLMGCVSGFERRAMDFLGVGLPFGHSTLVLCEKAGGSPISVS